MCHHYRLKLTRAHRRRRLRTEFAQDLVRIQDGVNACACVGEDSLVPAALESYLERTCCRSEMRQLDTYSCVLLNLR